jgi:hypothetical protein
MSTKRSPLARGLIAFFVRLNRRVPWHRLPTRIGILNLLAFRYVLRDENLHDTLTPGSLRRRPADEVVPPEKIRYRTADGSYNDLDYPEMGKAGTRFARNVPLEKAFPGPPESLMEPNPREISRRLMKRDKFVPATSLNLLAAAWIQFQTHDWFNHGRDLSRPVEIPLPEGDDWPEPSITIPSTRADHTRCPMDRGLPPTCINTESHWWDASSIYGSTDEQMNRLRSHEGGRLVVQEDGQLPVDPETGFGLTGFNENWWLGLGLLHTLFSLEHNAICDRLQEEYPDWSDEELFQTARLINAALTAKIHTVEWTPAIIAHPVLKIAMRANWWGLAEEKIYNRYGRISSSEAISGIPGSPADHHGAPFQLTEEFVSVYRLHPLIPDEVRIHSMESGELVRTLPFKEIILEKAPALLGHDLEMSDAWYSFGIAHPGAVVLRNFPEFLRDLTLPDGVHLDLAAVDIYRDRERGIPRYNEFRRLLHLEPAESFDDLTDNPEWAREMEDVYGGDIELVDLQVGMMAETFPAGFGFSDTAFRVFILMASRRLKSDRFFTDCFTPEYYTQVGMDWIQSNDMSSVLLRHYPELAPALEGTENAFAPWKRVGSA